MAAELAKLESQAGTSGQSVGATGAILDLAAARGFNSAEAMQAVQQAMLGIDEGTDKLFGKNPSGLWADYAAKIGTTAGKLTDAQKQQALLDAIMTEGAKVQGEYARMMEGPIGASQDLSVATDELRGAGGQLVTEALAPAIRHLADLAQAVNAAPEPVRRVAGVAGLATSAFIALRLSGITPTLGVLARAPAVLRLARVQLAATGATARGPVALGFRSAGIAVKGFWASLGPVGWAVLGITALAEAVFFLTGSKHDATAASEEHAEALAAEAEAYRNLSLDELAESERAVTAGKEQLTEAVREQEVEVARLRAEWQDLVRAQMRSARESMSLPGRAELEQAEAALAATRANLDENARQEQALADERRHRNEAEAREQQARDDAATRAAAQRREAAARQAAADARRRQQEADRLARERAEAQAALRLEIEGETAARRSALERQALDLERWYAEQKTVAGSTGELRGQLDAEYLARRTAMYRAATNQQRREDLDLQAERLRLAGATDLEIVRLYYDAVQQMHEAAEGGSEAQRQLRLELLRLSNETEAAMRENARARQEAEAAEFELRLAEIEVEGATVAASRSGSARVVAEQATEAEVSRLRLAALQARLAAQETYEGMTTQAARTEAARLRQAIVQEQSRIADASRKTSQAVADDAARQVDAVLDQVERATGAMFRELTRERERRTDEEVALDRGRFRDERARLDEQLRRREVSREEHATRIREIALSESEYEAGLAEERESRLRRGARATTDYLLAESGRYLAKLARDKVVELAVHTTTEEGKTVVSAVATAQRIATYLAEQAAALAQAGASMVSAAANAIASGARLPFPANIPAIALGVGAVGVAYLGAKKLFGFERGGYFGQPGEAGRDEPVVGLGRGEAVLTRHHQAPVNRALKSVYGYDLGGLFDRVQIPHSASASSLLSAAGLPPGTPMYETGGFARPVPVASGADLGPLLTEMRAQGARLERATRAAETAAKAARDAKRVTGRTARDLRRAADNEDRSRR